MRRFQRFFLPFFTFLTVCCAILVPPQVSLLLDRQLIGRVHTETLVGDGNFTLPSTTMAQRVGLLAALVDRNSYTDHAYTIQAMEDGDQEAAREMALRELKAFQEAGWLSSLLVPEELSLYCYRFYARQAEDNTWASFLHVDIDCLPLGFQAEMILDEETGMALRLELTQNTQYTLYRKYPVLQKLPDFGRWFFDRLGLEEYRTSPEEPNYMVFSLPDGQVAYHIIHSDAVISVIPYPVSG